MDGTRAARQQDPRNRTICCTAVSGDPGHKALFARFGH